MRNLFSHLVGGVLILSSLAATCPSMAEAGTIRDDRNPLLYTSLATQLRYSSVGLINEHGPSNSLIASGVLIAPDIVLTAAHVVDHATSLKFTVGGTEYSGSRWVANPNWTGDLSTGYDLGIVQLSAPVSGVTPAIRYTGDSELGSVATFVGYGMTGTGITGATNYDTVKRAGMNVYDTNYGSNPRLLMSDFDNPHAIADSIYGSAIPLSLEFLIGSGDSGGGSFLETDQGTRLAGIHTFGTAPDGMNNADYGDTSGDIRISLFNAWIDDMIAQYAPTANALYQPGSNLVPTSLSAPLNSVPEPSSFALLFAGLAPFAWIWRGRRRPG